MTEGSCRRLLAIFSLIFVASVFLRGQDGAAQRELAPNLSPRRYTLPVQPGDRLLVPELPERYPVARYPVARPLVPIDPDAPGVNLFRQMVRSAGLIFSGRVISVGHATTFSRSASTSVTFQVERALRGASPGQILTIQEWSGRWADGERYRVDERVLLFLYAPSKLGLTSTVAGLLGRFAVDSRGNIVMSAQHVANLMGDPMLGGKASVPYAAFALAVQRSIAEE